MTGKKELQLIKKYKLSGNPLYLGQLYEPYMPLVYGVCLKYLRNREEAQDAVMDIYEKLGKELLKHDIPKDFRTWLYVVSKNFCLMEIRKKKKEHTRDKEIAMDFMENGFELHPLDKEENTDRTEALKKCMEQLKDQQRKSIELFYYQKYCYKEIADRLAIQEKTVKSAIQNAKRNLKLCLEENHE